MTNTNSARTRVSFHPFVRTTRPNDPEPHFPPQEQNPKGQNPPRLRQNRPHSVCMPFVRTAPMTVYIPFVRTAPTVSLVRTAPTVLYIPFVNNAPNEQNPRNEHRSINPRQHSRKGDGWEGHTIR